MIASIGFYGDRRRRWVSRPAIRDLRYVDVDCGRLSVCISGVSNTVVSTSGRNLDFWRPGHIPAAVLGPVLTQRASGGQSARTVTTSS